MRAEYAAPHLRATYCTKTIMQNLVISLLPSLCGAIYFFGIRALLMTVFSAAVCALAEYLWQKIRGQQITAGDFSAVATGILLAFNMPVTTPFWVLAAADLFAVIVVKQMFGGIGNNFVNPALMGRLFVMTVWAGSLTKYVIPGNDAVSSATVMSSIKQQAQPSFTYLQMFLGDIPGAIGETSKVLLLVGFVYLCYRQLVNWKAALIYIMTVSVMTFVIGPKGLFTGDFLGNLLGGSLIMGGFYMLTDYAFVSRKGRLLFAFTAGIITALVRIFSVYTEVVCFGILAANCLAGFLSMIERRHVYGLGEKSRRRKISWVREGGREDAK